MSERDDYADSLAECRDCDIEWIGPEAWGSAFAHMRATHHAITISETI